MASSFRRIGNKTSASSLSRIKERLHRTFEIGEYYEAHQQYKSLFARYEHHRLHDALSLAIDGSNIFLRAGETSSGADIACLFVSKLKEKAVPRQRPLDENESYLDSIEDLVPLFGSENDARETFLNLAIGWAKDLNDTEACERIYFAWAKALETNGCFGFSQEKFMQCSRKRAPDFAKMLSNWAKRGNNEEFGRFLLRASLLLINMDKVAFAKDLHYSFTSGYPTLQDKPNKSVHLNFNRLLLRSLDLGERSMFQVLKSTYKHMLSEDPELEAFVGRIERRNFPSTTNSEGSTQPPNSLIASLLTSQAGPILSSFMQGLSNMD